MSFDTPGAYKRGYIEFYKLNFKVNPDVLIPRPETEIIVDEVLKYARANKGRELKILDVGTGSGNIAISVAKNLVLYSPDITFKIIATELSSKALKVAKQNAKLHQVEDKIEFLRSDLLKTVDKKSFFDLIATNLPYIPGYRIPVLDDSVKNYEPHIALDGGGDGFELYRKLFQELVKYDISFNLLIGEIDYTQAEIAKDEAEKYFKNSSVEIKLDLTYRQRFLYINY